jgi:hypothetical protein
LFFAVGYFVRERHAISGRERDLKDVHLLENLLKIVNPVA